MPILRKKEIREMKDEKRKEKLRELRVELGKLKTTIEAGGNIENPSKIKEIRRTIARVLTISRERKKNDTFQS